MHTAHITPYYSLYSKEYSHISCITPRALRSGEVLLQDGMQNLSRYPNYSILLTLSNRISHNTRATHIKRALTSRHAEYLILSTLLYITPCYSYNYYYSYYSCAQVWRSASGRRRNADLCCMKGLPTPIRHTRMCSAATHCNTLQHTASYCSTLQHRTLLEGYQLHFASLVCVLLSHNATHCNTLQHAATRYNILQHNATQNPARGLPTPLRLIRMCSAATQCNTMQHTVTHCKT